MALAIIISYHEWNSKYCFIKNDQEILLDLANFTLQEQPEDNNGLISRAWYNGSYIPWPYSQSNHWNCITQ